MWNTHLVFFSLVAGLTLDVVYTFGLFLSRCRSYIGCGIHNLVFFSLVAGLTSDVEYTFGLFLSCCRSYIGCGIHIWSFSLLLQVLHRMWYTHLVFFSLVAGLTSDVEYTIGLFLSFAGLTSDVEYTIGLFLSRCRSYIGCGIHIWSFSLLLQVLHLGSYIGCGIHIWSFSLLLQVLHWMWNTHLVFFSLVAGLTSDVEYTIGLFLSRCRSYIGCGIHIWSFSLLLQVLHRMWNTHLVIFSLVAGLTLDVVYTFGLFLSCCRSYIGCGIHIWSFSLFCRSYIRCGIHNWSFSLSLPVLHRMWYTHLVFFSLVAGLTSDVEYTFGLFLSCCRSYIGCGIHIWSFSLLLQVLHQMWNTQLVFFSLVAGLTSDVVYTFGLFLSCCRSYIGCGIHIWSFSLLLQVLHWMWYTHLVFFSLVAGLTLDVEYTFGLFLSCCRSYIRCGIHNWSFSLSLQVLHRMWYTHLVFFSLVAGLTSDVVYTFGLFLSCCRSYIGCGIHIWSFSLLLQVLHQMWNTQLVFFSLVAGLTSDVEYTIGLFLSCCRSYIRCGIHNWSFSLLLQVLHQMWNTQLVFFSLVAGLTSDVEYTIGLFLSRCRSYIGCGIHIWSFSLSLHALHRMWYTHLVFFSVVAGLTSDVEYTIGLFLSCCRSYIRCGIHNWSFSLSLQVLHRMWYTHLVFFSLVAGLTSDVEYTIGLFLSRCRSYIGCGIHIWSFSLSLQVLHRMWNTHLVFFSLVAGLTLDVEYTFGLFLSCCWSYIGCGIHNWSFSLLLQVLYRMWNTHLVFFSLVAGLTGLELPTSPLVHTLVKDKVRLVCLLNN